MDFFRKELIDFLCYYDILTLKEGARESIIIDLLSEDDAFLNVENFSDAKYNELLREYLLIKYKGIKNEYIENKVTTLINNKVKIVDDEVLLLEKCPCCGYRTIDERGQYFVCPGCYWEDDGSDELNRYSPANKLTLEEAKENFKNIGAISESFVNVVDNECSLKYKL